MRRRVTQEPPHLSARPESECLVKGTHSYRGPHPHSSHLRYPDPDSCVCCGGHVASGCPSAHTLFRKIDKGKSADWDYELFRSESWRRGFEQLPCRERCTFSAAFLFSRNGTPRIRITSNPHSKTHRWLFIQSILNMTSLIWSDTMKSVSKYNELTLTAKRSDPRNAYFGAVGSS